MHTKTSTRGVLPRITLLSALLWLLLPGRLLAQHTDPEMNGEHEAAMNLVPASSATHTASADGNWASGATWNTGTVPGAGSRVVIPAGRTVTYNSTSTANVSWVRVEGTFRFSTTQSTVLNVETIVVTPTGYYEQGTSASPIPAAYTSVITFVDNGALTDTYKLARGLIAHGKTRIHGASLTAFLKTTAGLAAGATQATLASVPSNWKVGDQVAITGMRYNQDEIKTISAISGSTITFNSGLTNMRKVDFATWGVYPYLANTTRNIRYRSANTGDHSRKGHVMFMHNPDVDVRYAGFYDLGRTRKDIPVTDSETASLPTGDNPRGKYALHFHRTGHKNASIAPAYVVGCAVVNSPGWGYVNHDSYVNFEDNVSYNAVGAHYVLENGAERGAFRRNIAMKATGGSNRFIKTGVDTHDLAHSGHGFWFQGGNYIAENNVASGCSDGGFTWFSRSNLAHNQSENQFVPAGLLLEPAQAGGRTGYESADLPIMSHKNNTAMGCYHGMIAIDVEINGTGPTNSVIENFISLNAAGAAGIMLEYYRNFTFRNTKVLRDNDFPWNQWEAAYGIQAFNLIDHQYPFLTRSADRAIGLVVRNHGVAVRNFENATSDGRGEAVGMAKWQVIGAAVDHNCPNGAFNNTGTYNGVALVQNIASEADVVPLPTFSPVAGTYAATQTVSIGTVTGATIYYVVGTQGYVSPSLESQLKPGSWTQYTGPVTISANRKLIAVAVRNGQYSRINSGYFTINASAPADTQAPTVPANLASTGKTTASVSLSWSASTDNVGVTGYDVYRGGTFAGSATSTSYTATGLSAATAYTFTVRAKDAAGNQSAASSGLTVTTNAGTAPTTATLTPVADTDTQSDVAAGTNTSLNASQWNTLFVKFNLSTLSGTVSSAKLRVYKNNTNTGTLNVNGASPDSWTEGGAKPTLGGLITTAPMGGTAGYIEIDVTGTVNAEAAGDDLVTFGLTTNLGGWTGFNARENAANKPQLVVTYGSGARLAAAGPEAGALRVFPNPASAGVVHVRYQAAAAGEATLLLTNALGRSAARRTFAAIPGDNTVTLATAGVAPGLYLITVQQGTTRRVTKVYLR